MSHDLLVAARAEERRLLKELEATPLFRRLEAVRAVLGVYQDSLHVPLSEATGPRPPRARSSRAESVTAQVTAAAEGYLRKQQRRAQSLEILQAAQDAGIEVPGAKPTTVVASILSHSELFDNVRGQGYGLREWAADANESDAPAAPSHDLADNTKQILESDEEELGLERHTDRHTGPVEPEAYSPSRSHSDTGQVEDTHGWSSSKEDDRLAEGNTMAT